MTKPKDPETKQEAKEREEDEARGDTDLVILTNDSGEVKKLSQGDWEEQEVVLKMDGWYRQGDEERP